MGGSLQRLEVLIAGGMMLLAGLVVTLLWFVRPPASGTYTIATPGPVMASEDVTGTAAQPVVASVPTQVPTLVLTMQPKEMPIVVGPTLPSIQESSITRWSLLLLAVGGLGLGAVGTRVLRRRRMAYTGQNIGMFLSAADTATRDTNLRVMRELQAQGQLSGELAAAAGLVTGSREVALRVRLPQIVLPTIRLSLPVLRLTTFKAGIGTVRQSIQALQQRRAVQSPVPLAIPDVQVVPESDQAAFEEAPSSVLQSADAPAWSAEDRILAVAGVLAGIWHEHGWRSPLLAFDTSTGRGSGSVIVTLDPHPDEEEHLVELPELVATQMPGWRARWKASPEATAQLVIHGCIGGALPDSGPLLLPALMHGRNNAILRMLPLTTIHQIGIYGADAAGVLHAILASLLYSQAPDRLALTLCDDGRLAPLYHGVAHVVQPVGDMLTTIEQVIQTLRNPSAQRVERSLILVVVEPDTAALTALNTLVRLLRQQPSAPVYLLLVQEQLHQAGREVYAQLPALMTSGGRGSAAWLPGQQAWPAPGAARLLVRRAYLDGKALILTEAALAAALSAVRQPIADVPPVLWGEVPQTLAQSIDCGNQLERKPEEDQLVPASSIDDQASNVQQASEIDVADTEEAPPETAHILQEASETGANPFLQPVDTHSAQNSTLESEPGADAVEVLAGEDAQEAQEPSSLTHFLRAVSHGQAITLPPAPALIIPSEETTSLAAGLSGAEEHAPMSFAVDEREHLWPLGPAPLGRLNLADLMAQVISSPAIVAGQANEQGVTKNRLAELLRDMPKAQARELAEVLMAWFDLAGLLALPSRPERLRHPRMLITTELTTIAAHLTATPLPDRDMVATLWADVPEGRL